MTIEEMLQKETLNLKRVCDDNELEYTFENDKFPIVLTIIPDGELRNQIEMDIAGDGDIKDTGQIKFIFADGLSIAIDDDFEIQEDVFNKLRGLAKKIHYLFLQIYFKNEMNK